VTRVIVPGLPVGALYGAHKVSKRFDQDISAVCGAFRVLLEQDRVREARFAYGGMAATPKRAGQAERAVVGDAWSEANVRRAMDAMAHDFAPITDARGSAAYRLKTAQNLLLRFFLENVSGSPETRAIDAKALVHG
jgi:xanthine dehydrogenase small subunit